MIGNIVISCLSAAAFDVLYMLQFCSVKHAVAARALCMLQGVANRDLKLENLLLTFKEGWARPLLKICDFGYSKVLMLDAVL